jgi:hypothetical protein
MSLNIYITQSDMCTHESATVVAATEEDARKMHPWSEKYTNSVTDEYHPVNIWLIGVADETYDKPCVVISSFKKE